MTPTLSYARRRFEAARSAWCDKKNLNREQFKYLLKKQGKIKESTSELSDNQLMELAEGIQAELNYEAYV